MDWEERYRQLWAKFYSLSLRDCWLLEEEICDIDAQIRYLQRRRAKLVARKHQESRERIQEEEKRKKNNPLLYLPFAKNRG